MKRMVLALLHGAWLGTLLLGLPPSLVAAPTSTYRVVSTLDNPDASPGNNVCADVNSSCTLRAAIMEANAHVGPDTILLPADTFHLTVPGGSEDAANTGDLDLAGVVTLQGVSAAATIIDAAGLNDRALQVLAGAQVTLSDLTLRGGSVPTTGLKYGGGLLNAGTLTLTRVLLTHNNLGGMGSNRYGGGLANLSTGWLALRASQVISNEAFSGAIFNQGLMVISNTQVLSNSAVFAAGIANAGTLALSHSQVLSNFASGTGGGLGNITGQLTVEDSLISGNTAGAAGGVNQGGGALIIAGSTIDGNQASGNNGGLAVSSGAVTLTASTLSHNSAGLNGGGIWQQGGSLAVVNTTIAQNLAGGDGGGLWLNGGSFSAYNLTMAENAANADHLGSGSGGGLFQVFSGTVNLNNTLLTGNQSVVINLAIANDCAGTFGTFRYSLLGTAVGCTFTPDHTLIGASAILLPLADNGGPTKTMALGTGSAALEAGDPAGCSGPDGRLATDQRGLPRHADSNRDGVARCDMGAYEMVLQLFLPLLRR